ncbi:PD-(D/E)XK nuclease-like domain-containing protein [Micromonospora sp. NPDC053740]|uniref:PD-(D/E)XK nuclease-like domain-containing protein n=1 Tax=Micromonospora sp. NPDC053740 TaxID=3155173 RepID=UPI003436FFAF
MIKTSERLIAPGGVYNIPETLYHSDPVPGGSLSCSGAKKLLPPSCPALFRHEQENGQPHKKAFDIGSAAHKMVLGVGPDLVQIDAEEWRSNAVKAEVAAVRHNGGIPLKPSEMAQIKAMGKALREHPIASALLTPEGGKAEQTLVWQDTETGIACRALVDWLPNRNGNRLVIGDYKSSVSANPEDFRKAAYNYGYCMQNPWYLDGIRALDLEEDPDFVFVVQMKTPPYLVSLIRLDEEALRIGAERNRKARRVFADCLESGVWPGFTDTEIAEVSLPSYATYQHNNDFES